MEINSRKVEKEGNVSSLVSTRFCETGGYENGWSWGCGPPDGIERLRHPPPDGSLHAARAALTTPGARNPNP